MLVLSVLYVRSVRRRYYQSERRRRRQREAARRKRIAVFIAMQAQWKMALLLMITGASMLTQRAERNSWVIPRSSRFWEEDVLSIFSNQMWLENFRMTKETFLYVCCELRERIKKDDTIMRAAIPVEKRVAVALWRLATNCEFRTIGHLFGISRSTACVIVQKVCQAIVDVLMPKHIKKTPRVAN